MYRLERAPEFEQEPPFDVSFDLSDIDVNAAFQDAITGVMTDEELALDQKVQRMEVIMRESTSEFYRDFVDVQAVAAQMQVACMHDHSLNTAFQGNDALSTFMDAHLVKDGHDHAGHEHQESKHSHDDDDDDIDPLTGKKRRRKRRS